MKSILVCSVDGTYQEDYVNLLGEQYISREIWW